MISPYVPAGYSSVAVDSKNSDIVYVGVDMIGLYKSVDRGMTWVPIGSDDGGPQGIYKMIARNIILEKDHADTLHEGRLCGFAKSTDECLW